MLETSSLEDARWQLAGQRERQAVRKQRLLDAVRGLAAEESQAGTLVFVTDVEKRLREFRDGVWYLRLMEAEVERQKALEAPCMHCAVEHDDEGA